ncbi:thioesterase family protein [Actinomadura hibisca]|uniref:thioesterase family protein n=1 Tax=Actinomadura hibisca TaxID=68565 RepID=UPI00082F73C9
MDVGLRAERVFTVGEADTAERVGSGDLPVLGTPRLLAFAEAVTLQVLAGRLGEGETSVGTRVELEHRAASLVGARVRVVAELIEVDGRRLGFRVTATDEGGALVGFGLVERVVVSGERFLSRLR